MWAQGRDYPDPLLAVYSSAPLRRGEILAWSILSVIILLIVSGVGIYQLYDGYTHYGPVAAQIWATPWLISSAAIVLALLVSATWRGLIARRTLEVRAHGVQTQPALGQARYLPWEQLTGIAVVSTQSTFFGRPFSTTHQIKIFIVGRPAIVLSGRSSKLLEIATLLKANLYPRLLPVLRANFRDRKSVPFGRLSISHETGIEIHRGILGMAWHGLIRRNNGFYPWDQIRRVTVQGGYLMVESNQNIRTVLPVGHIPNLELFFQLLREEAHL